MKKMLFLLVIVVLIAGFSSNAYSQIGLKAVAPQVGVIFPEDPFSTGFNLGAVANLGEFYENIGLYPALLYWSAGGDQGGADVSFTNFQIAADVHYHTEDLEGFFAGLGLSLNFLSADVSVTIPNPLGGPAFTSSGSESYTRVGFGIFLGYEMPVGDSIGFVKGKFDVISDFNTFKIDVGYYFDIK
jgi:hypothetical protein